MKEVIYLSGKISGEDIKDNLQRFVDKGVELSKDYAVILPGENNGKMGIQGGWDWKDFMRADIPVMLKCDAVYMLSNWKESRGAKIEHWLAKRNGKKIIYEPVHSYRVKAEDIFSAEYPDDGKYDSSGERI